jgi:NADPH:quinone reductase-like Zn-dependent oxidoreductase
MSSKTSAQTPAVPPTMRAAAVDHFGPPSALRLHTLPVPKPRPHQVLAEYVAVDAEDVDRVPKVLDPLHAGAAL